MFQSSTRIHPALKEDVERAEALVGYQVLSAQIFRIPYALYEIQCEIRQSRQMGLLEEFLLRAAVELDPPIKSDDLADMLRVDFRFVEQTYRELINLQALMPSTERFLQATATGEQYYRQDRMPQPPQLISLGLLSVLPFSTFALHNNSSRLKKQLLDENFPELPYSSLAETTNPIYQRTDISDELVVKVAEQAGKPLNQPEEGISIEGVTDWRVLPDLGYSHWAILVKRDLLAD